MSDLEKVVVKLAAPIPLGHRVEVVWYQVVKEGWRGTSVDEHPYSPRVTDLESGIEYLNSGLVGEGGSWTCAEPKKVFDNVPEPFEVQRVLTGTVRRCRLVTIGDYEIGIQTHLDIEPDVEQPAYR